MKEKNELRINAANKINQTHFNDVGNFQISLKSFNLRIAFFNKLHDSNVFIKNYEKVLMMIIKFKIATQLPFLKELIQEFNLSEIRTRNIYMI